MNNINNFYDYSKLSECTVYNLVDGILDEMGVCKELQQRIALLYMFMGITQVFGDNLSAEDTYNYAIRQLVLMNQRRN